jgi:hypothetical protein
MTITMAGPAIAAAGGLVPARPLAAQAHALRAAAAFLERAGIPGLHLTIYLGQVTIQVPSDLAGPDVRTAAVRLLAAAAGGQVTADGRWVTANGDLAGHPVRIFTAIKDTP